MRELTEQQLNAVTILSNQKVGYIVAPPGAGKTITSLILLKELLQKRVIKQALVIAPPNVIYSAWVRELDSWHELAGISYSVLNGSAHERVELLAKKVDIRFISDNLVPWLVTSAVKNKIRLGECLIIDEITRWGSAGSQRVRAIRAYTTKCGEWAHAYALTATPVSESWDGLYSHFVVLDAGARLGTRIFRYRELYFDKADWYGYKYKLKKRGAERISDRISDAVYNLPAVHEKLPTKTVMYTLVCVPLDAITVSQRLKNNRVVNIKGHEIIAGNAAVLSLKLAQAACGALYMTNSDDGTSTKDYVVIHKSKMIKIAKMIDNVGKKNVIIVYQYGFELKWLRELFPYATVLTGLSGSALNKAINRDDTEQTGRIVLLHPQSAGRGVEGLQDGFSNMIWTAPPWSRELWIQTCGRIWRTGQEQEVLIEVLQAENSIDAVKLATVENKGKFEVLFEKFLGDKHER